MKTNGTLLAERFDRIIKHGEVPYSANRDALKAFDILRDDDEGYRALMVMVEGLDIFIGDLEAFEHDTQIIAKQAVSGFR